MSIYENNLRITSFTETTAVGNSFVIPIVDVSDTTMSSNGTTKKITYSSLFGQIESDLNLATVARTGDYNNLGNKPTAGIDFLSPTGDGSGLTNVNAASVKNFGLSGYTGTIGAPLLTYPYATVLSVYANTFYGSFNGDGSNLQNVSAQVAYSVAPSGLSAYEGYIGLNSPESVKFYGKFYGDASGLYNLPNAGPAGGFIYKLSNDGTSIYPNINSNDANFAGFSFIGNGDTNKLLGSRSVIVGGENNILSASNYSGIVGGTNNGSDSQYIFIGGGASNQIIGSNYSSILGGQNNTISSKPNTFIIGSNITASLSNYTYFNNVSSQGMVASDYIQSKGGFIDGNLTISGNVTALGTATYQNTIFTTTSALSVINTGQYGPALYVEQNGGFGDVASFYDADGVEVLHVGNGLYPDISANPVHETGIVGIMTSTPNKTLTVSGEISASSDIYSGGIIYDSTHSSLNWTSVYTNVQTKSADWDSVYTTVDTKSGGWDSIYNTVSNASGDWDSVYSTVETESGNWNSVYNTVSGASGNWDSVYNTVSSTSSDWNSSYNTLSGASGNWDSVYTTVSGSSASWNGIYTELLPITARSESTYTTLCSNSAYWESLLSALDFYYDDWVTAFILSHNQDTDTGTISSSFTIKLDSPDAITLSAVSGTEIRFLDVTETNLIDLRAKDIILEGDVKSTTGTNYTTRWNTTYTTVCTYSAIWADDGGTASSISAVSSNWNSSYNALTSNSANWDSSYTTLTSNSSNWKNSYNTLTSNSANWDSSYTTLTSNSSNWVNTYNAVTAASSNWATNTRRLTATIGDNASTYFTVTHNLSVGYVLVQVYNNTSQEIVYPTIKYVNNNSVGLTFSYAIPSASHTVLIIG